MEYSFKVGNPLPLNYSPSRPVMLTQPPHHTLSQRPFRPVAQGYAPYGSFWFWRFRRLQGSHGTLLRAYSEEGSTCAPGD